MTNNSSFIKSVQERKDKIDKAKDLNKRAYEYERKAVNMRDEAFKLMKEADNS